MDHGRLTDRNGKPTDFRRVVLLMTSNIGVHDLQRRAVGFGGAAGEDRDQPGIDREYKQLFSPEFRNRLDAKIAFKELHPSTMKSIVGKFVKELGEQLAERKVSIELTAAATDYLAVKGYDKDNGARPLARVVQEELKRPGRGCTTTALENWRARGRGRREEDGKDALTFRFDKKAEEPASKADVPAAKVDPKDLN